MTHGESEPAAKTWVMTPREMLFLFTAGWLGGTGLLTALDAGAAADVRIIAAAEVIAAGLWFVPRLRMAGLGAMLAILGLAIVHHLLGGIYPGALLFYAAIVIYLAVEQHRAGGG